MKKVLYATCTCLVVISLIAGCSKSNTNSNPPAGTSNTISISGMSFSPSSKTVAKGTVVKWVNNGSNDHTATSNDGTTFDTNVLSPGASYSYIANTPGTFAYHCTIHGLTMAGTLIVNP